MTLGHPGLSAWARRIVAVALVGALAGCAIRFISSYDETTDKAVSALQKKTATHFVTLEGVEGKPDCAYERQKVFYDESKVEASAIAVRAAALPKNEITTQQAMLLADSLDNLEKLHRLSCLSKDQIRVLREQFNTSFTAILKLELAKKRGE